MKRRINENTILFKYILRLVVLYGNFVFLVLTIIAFTGLFPDKGAYSVLYLVLIPAIILIIFNIYILISPHSSYMKRKILEEEIKIQGYKNRLIALQKKKIIIKKRGRKY